MTLEVRQHSVSPRVNTAARFPYAGTQPPSFTTGLASDPKIFSLLLDLATPGHPSELTTSMRKARPRFDRIHSFASEPCFTALRTGTRAVLRTVDVHLTLR